MSEIHFFKQEKNCFGFPGPTKAGLEVLLILFEILVFKDSMIVSVFFFPCFIITQYFRKLSVN